VAIFVVVWWYSSSPDPTAKLLVILFTAADNRSSVFLRLLKFLLSVNFNDAAIVDDEYSSDSVVGVCLLRQQLIGATNWNASVLRNRHLAAMVMVKAMRILCAMIFWSPSPRLSDLGRQEEWSLVRRYSKWIVMMDMDSQVRSGRCDDSSIPLLLGSQQKARTVQSKLRLGAIYSIRTESNVIISAAGSRKHSAGQRCLHFFLCMNVVFLHAAITESAGNASCCEL